MSFHFFFGADLGGLFLTFFPFSSRGGGGASGMTRTSSNFVKSTLGTNSACWDAVLHLLDLSYLPYHQPFGKISTQARGDRHISNDHVL